MARLIRPAKLRIPSEMERHATWLELFFDLIFVVIITELATRMLHHLNYAGIFECIALFLPVMWTWMCYTVFAARFDNEDLLHWSMSFIIMFSGVIMAKQIPTALESGAAAFSIGFILAQLCIFLLYLKVLYDNSAPRNILTLYLIGFGLADLIWIISLFFSTPSKFYFWAIGILIYLAVPILGKRILAKAPLDPFYIPERFGLFTIIVLGQTIASVVLGLKASEWDVFAFETSIVAFLLAIIIWGQYNRFIHIANYKCSLSSGQSYIYSHLPLIIGLIIMGVCIEFFIKHPTIINVQVNAIFCFGIFLYLTGFYMLQYIAIPSFGIRSLSYFMGTGSILILFLIYQGKPATTLPILLLIFIALFSIQFWLGYRYQGRR